jgi:hypothetical protein
MQQSGGQEGKNDTQNKVQKFTVLKWWVLSFEG